METHPHIDPQNKDGHQPVHKPPPFAWRFCGVVKPTNTRVDPSGELCVKMFQVSTGVCVYIYIYIYAFIQHHPTPNKQEFLHRAPLAVILHIHVQISQSTVPDV